MGATISRLLAKLGIGGRTSGKYYVTGSGLVNIPTDRLAEIPRVIGEYHALEAERAKRLAATRAGQMM
jgi:hypothetical protein